MCKIDMQICLIVVTQEPQIIFGCQDNSQEIDIEILYFLKEKMSSNKLQNKYK